MKGITLEKVGPRNLADCGIGCLGPRNLGYRPKVDWLERRFGEGLRFLLFRDAEGRPLGFLEYVPGEYAWRPVEAEGWLFVHCLWVYSRGKQVGGLGSRLIRACLDEARRARAVGVAAMVSDGVWMAGKEIFLKNGFTQVAQADRFDLLVHRLKKKGPDPGFRKLGRRHEKARGLQLIYCAQCPMLPKSAHDLSEMAAEHGLQLQVRVLDSARAAQRAPSYYGVYNLLWNGKLLSDHYVSRGRFKNLLRKEILK